MESMAIGNIRSKWGRGKCLDEVSKDMKSIFFKFQQHFGELIEWMSAPAWQEVLNYVRTYLTTFYF